MQRERTLTLVILLVVSILGGMTVFYATHWGPWALSDGAGYIMNARSLRAGLGLTLPSPNETGGLTTHMPPLYMLTIAIFGKGTDQLVNGSRWLGIVSFSLLILLTGVAVYHLSGDQHLAITLSLIICASPDLISIFSAVMSEPLFLLLGFCSIFLLLYYQKRQLGLIYAFSAICAGLAAITRYVGITFVISGAVIYWLGNNQKISRRILRTLSYILLGLLPLSIWQIVIALHAGAEPARSITISLADLWQRTEPIRGAYVDMLWRLIPFVDVLPSVPYMFRFAIVSISIFLILFLSWVLSRKAKLRIRQEPDPTNRVELTVAFLIFFATYLATVAISYLFTKPAPDLSSRILLPAKVVFLLALVSLIFWFTRSFSRSPWARLVPLIVAVMILANSLPPDVELISKLHQSGRGYTGREWRSSAVLSEVGNIPPDVPLISNDPVAIEFFFNRPVYFMPEVTPGNDLPEIMRYGDNQEQDAHEAFRQGGGALVLFNSIYWQLYPQYGEDTNAVLQRMTSGLRLGVDAWDGKIYYYQDLP